MAAIIFNVYTQVFYIQIAMNNTRFKNLKIQNNKLYRLNRKNKYSSIIYKLYYNLNLHARRIIFRDYNIIVFCFMKRLQFFHTTIRNR